MQYSEANPYRSPLGTQSIATANSPRLNWVGRMLLCIACIAAIAFFAYWGVQLGTIIGIERGMPHLTAPPTKGVGMAPDLSGIADAAMEYGVTMILSLLISVGFGTLFTGTGSYFILAPLLRRIRAFTLNS